MKVTANEEVLNYLKEYLANKQKKAVRFQLVEVCCGNADIEMVYDEEREDDISFELEGVKFVAKKEYGFLISNVKLERTEYGVDIKKSYCC
jgi:Fe-S cluster assembly iron-binding protein IscA